MPNQRLALLIGALLVLVAGGLTLPQFLAEGETAPLRWSEHEEIEWEAPAEAQAPAGSEGEPQRIEVEATDGSVPAADVRVAALLRGRVVDRFGAPQAGARVWLDFGRGGQRFGPGDRQRRVPDPVETDSSGRFAFEGQTFRSLRVTLQVLHPAHAPGLFDKDVGEVRGEVDLGDLVIERGGELVGRVTDLDGNGIPGAAIALQPENANRMRFLRERAQMLAGTATDGNGYFRLPRIAAGDWSVGATAKNHTEGRSPVVAVENEQAVDIEDIRLGPGYEVTGQVQTVDGKPLATALVTLRSVRAANRGPGGREHQATTDAQGRFFVEHVPGAPMRVEARADGYLPLQLESIDPTWGQQLLLTLQDGLRVTGTVLDEDGAPVTQFAVRIVRVRGLPTPGLDPADAAQLFERLRNGNLDDAEREAIRDRLGRLRGEFDDGRRNGRQDGARPGGGANLRDLGRPESHPGGHFEATGLQEGVYELHVQSPEHARSVTEGIELRLGGTAPDLRVQLDRGVYVAGLVRDDRGQPVAGARISLRSPQQPRRPRGAADGGNQRDSEAFGREVARQFAGAQQNPETTTDAEGQFVLKHVSRGTYRLQAVAEGFADASLDPFELASDRSGVVLQLGTLGAVVGTVFGLGANDHTQARVAAVPTSLDGRLGMFRGRGPGGPFRTGVIAADGSYRIDGLLPGDYVVRSWIGSPQEWMRELGPKLFDGSLIPDVTVHSGQEARLDVRLQRAQLGTVEGSVLHNGVPGAGLQVELQREDGSAGLDRGGPGGRGMWGARTQQATVAASGRFRIEAVPAGTYRLTVQAGRRGGALHQETLLVAADSTTERLLVLQTVAVIGTVTREDGGDPRELGGRVSLLPGLTAPPDDLAAWQREHPSFDARLQDGGFRFDAIQPGDYLLVLNARGRERTMQPIRVGQGEVLVTVAAGKLRGATEPAATGTMPQAPRVQPR
jgi:protocatechuate 3,4-dioxygenase beta subunit